MVIPALAEHARFHAASAAEKYTFERGKTMKKFSKLLSIVLVIAMLATLFVGCGGSDTANDASADSSTAASDDASTLLIGGVGPLTGDYANYGTSVANAAQIAVDEINAAGGVNGMTLALDYQDSVGDPESAVNAYGKLIDSGMDVCMGGVLSGENASIAAAAAEDEMMLLSGNSNAFRICFTDSSQGVASADYIADNSMATQVAVFYQSDIDYSVGLYKAFEAQCAERGIEIVEVQTFTADTDTDFSTQINAIANCGVDLVFIPIYAAEASTFLTQASGKLDGKIFFGCDGLDGILTKVSDVAYAENVMMLTPFAADAEEENVQAFVAAYKEKYGAAPDQFAAGAYDAVYTIKAAIEHADITSADDPDLTAKLVAAMLEIEVTGVTGTMTWSEGGETTKAARAMIIHDGVATLYAA